MKRGEEEKETEMESRKEGREKRKLHALSPQEKTLHMLTTKN